MLTLKQLEQATALVHATMAPTPQYAWPLLAARLGREVWVKHENHTPTGAFKVRGGVVLIDRLLRSARPPAGIVSATRGNHGQSLAFAACRRGVRTVIVAPQGNSVEKNAAMRAWGAELVEHGADFDEAREYAAALAERDGLALIGPFREELVAGVASYAMELFCAVGDLDTVYVPIGCGSGICGLISVRDALGLGTRIVGVVAQGAPCYALSFVERRPIATETASTMADGVAVRVPVPEALDVILRGAERVVQVSDAQIRAAMRVLFSDTHNAAEGAGAAGLAALIQDGDRAGKRAAVILSGGNVDTDVFRGVLAA
jgi:threonine dehydratase